MQRVSPESKATVKHSGRRKLSGNESGEKSPSAKRQRGSQTPPKRSGVAHDGGQQFEVKMAAVIGLRGMARGDNFQLSTNKPGSGNFDDLVYTTSTGRYFMQLKHTDNPDTTNLVHSDLVPLLHQCFESYCQIIEGSIFKDIPLDRSEFIIYTNKQLGPKLSQHSRQQREIDVILKTSDKGEIFNFTPDKNKEIDVYTLVDDKVKNTKEFGDLSPPQRNFKLDMISQFFKKLIMVTGQKGQRELDAVIIEEIGKHDKVNAGPEVYERDLLYFKKRIETWWRNKKEKMTSEMVGSWLQKAKTESCLPVVKSLFNMSSKILVGTGVTFTNSEISRLQAELSNKRAVHLRSDAVTLCSILLLDCLPQSKCIFVSIECLQSHTDELLHAWVGGVWEWLIVSCDATVGERHISDTSLKISEIIKHAPLNKCVIILSSVQQVTGFVPIDHRFKFEQLSEESQAMVLDKKIDFQGCEVTMRSVLQQHGNVEHVLGAELVTDLITEETAVNIGGKLYDNTDYYAPRVLKMRIYLQLNALKTPDSYPDIFAVSGMKTKDLLKIVPSREIVGNFYFSVSVYKQKEIYNACESSRFIVLCSRDLETCFLKLCEKHSEKRLHWVEYNNGDLLWKMSRGGTDSLLHYVDAEKTRADKRIVAEYMKSGSCEVNEESIWDLGEGPVLVVAEPGMGKSTSATHLAWNKKLADPTSWVLRINWNENCRQLEEINPKTCNIDNIVQFFGSAVFPVSKYYNLSKTLLKQALEVSGNITVLTNGYEQISPIDADKADVILATLRKTRVSRICVMSCPVTRERLEKRLAVEALTLEPLSNSSQELILLNHWTSKANTNTDQTCLIDFIKRLLSLTHKSVYDRSFTSSPFFIMMIATAFELNVETGDFSLPESLDLVYLYGRFFERGLHNYQLQKKKEGVQSNHEMLTSTFLKNVEGCALIDTLPSPVLKALHDKEIGEEIKPFVSEVLAGKHKTDLAISGLEGRPHFMHPQFAQCLTARWFSKNFESNRSVLENILFEPPYDVVKAEFDRILANGSELHCAVLNLNIKGVENLLQAGSDISARDRGGRTAMHLIAAQGDRACWAEDITESLLNHGACLCDEDNVMQWTPLRYAIKSGAWFVVEQLLKHNVDRKDLEVIINRVHDSDYIGEIVVEAVQQDCLLLVQFLKSIGVDIDQRFTVMKVTAMHVAADNRQLRIMRWLIEQGADCDISCDLDQTPLIKAARDGCIDTVRMLVEEGDASLNVRDIVGRTALDWAIIQAAGGADSQYFYDKESDGRIGAEAVVKYLRERGCKESDIPDGIVLEMITGFTSLSMDPTQ